MIMNNSWIDEIKSQFNYEIDSHKKIIELFSEAIKFENYDQFLDLFNIMVLLVFGIDSPNKIKFKDKHYNDDNNLIKKLCVDKDAKKWQNWFYGYLKMQYGGIHYLSSSFGIWHRTIFGKKWFTGIEKDIENQFTFDLHQHSLTYELLSLKENVFLDEKLTKIITIEIEQGRINGYELNEFSNFIIKLCREDKIYHSIMMHELNDEDERIKSIEGLQEFKNIIATAKVIGLDGVKDIEIFRKFTFILFRTLLFNNIKSINNQYIYIIPVTKFNDCHFGTFVGIFNKKLTVKGLNKLKYLIDNFLVNINILELSVKDEAIPRSLVVVEDNIRKCTRIPDLEFSDYSKIVEKVKSDEELELFDDNDNRYGKSLKELIKKLAITDEEKKWITRSIIPKFIGANSKLLEVLESLKFNLNLNAGKKEAILLYSEPGNGKEIIAQLCHLFSKRWIKGNGIKNTIEDKNLIKEIKESLDSKFRGNKVLYTSPDKDKNNKLHIKIKDTNDYLEKILSYNFYSFHSGLLTNNNFRKILFGKYDDNNHLIPGEFHLSHLTGGTLFLDEINTISDPKLSSWFLRTIEKPYSIIPENYFSSIDNINVLTIFASNLSPSELKTIGFSSAMLSRLRTYEIPPLRDRVEDIPLLLNKFIWSNKRDYKKKDTIDLFKYVNIKKINIQGLHILTRLPWRENTRELKRFVNDLIASRVERKLTSKEISFDEIMRCIIRNEKKLLGK